VSEQTHKLGEVLRAAREAKGVDLVRVERDTKIRARYLSAMERGEYRELPGAVYTKGFLRNYGVYLGLDPEYLIDLYRLETASLPGRSAPAPPPRPITVRRSRALVVTPGAVAAVVLTVAVGAFVAWLGWELWNFGRTPSLRVLEPPGDVSNHREMSYVIRGMTEPNARVTVDGLRENPSTTADSTGAFQVAVELVPGSNVIKLSAFDPVTRRDSAEVVRTITVVTAVASPTPPAPVLTVEQPPADVTVASPVPVVGRLAPAVSVEIAATLVAAAPPSFAVVDGNGTAVSLTPAAPSAPTPLSVMTGADGAFSGELALAPGTWEVRVAAAGSEPVTRVVMVTPPAGLVGEIRVDGGASYLELEQDGTPVAGVWGGTAAAGERVPLQAQREVRLLVGNAGAVSLLLNGAETGVLGAPGDVVEWRITRNDG
jgi:cytoskeletal protein RodZ